MFPDWIVIDLDAQDIVKGAKRYKPTGMGSLFDLPDAAFEQVHPRASSGPHGGEFVKKPGAVATAPASPPHWDWRKLHASLQSDPHGQHDVLGRVANGHSNHEGDLSDVLDLLDVNAVGTKAHGIAWAVSKNPKASDATRQRAQLMYDTMKVPEDHADVAPTPPDPEPEPEPEPEPVPPADDPLAGMSEHRRAHVMHRAAQRANANKWRVAPATEHEGDDGKWYGTFGVPRGVETTGNSRVVGYSLMDSNGITFGTRSATQDEAQAKVDKHNAESAKQELERHAKMTDAQLGYVDPTIEPPKPTQDQIDAYQAKKSDRVTRMRERATKAQEESDARFAALHRIADNIPLGQPILVGHHSEKHARADQSRIEGHARAGIDAMKRAEYWEGAAASAEDNNAISSDDPQVLDKLKARLDFLQNKQERMKLVNSWHAKFVKKPESLDAAPLTDNEKARIRNYMPPYTWMPHPHATFELTNNGANMRRIEERLKRVTAQKVQAVADGPQETEKHGVRVVHNTEENRLQLFFPGKPSEEVRRELKSNGFRWSPTHGAWQRQPSNAATWGADRAIELYGKLGKGVGMDPLAEACWRLMKGVRRGMSRARLNFYSHSDHGKAFDDLIGHHAGLADSATGVAADYHGSFANALRGVREDLNGLTPGACRAIASVHRSSSKHSVYDDHAKAGFVGTAHGLHAAADIMDGHPVVKHLPTIRDGAVHDPTANGGKYHDGATISKSITADNHYRAIYNLGEKHLEESRKVEAESPGTDARSYHVGVRAGLHTGALSTLRPEYAEDHVRDIEQTTGPHFTRGYRDGLKAAHDHIHRGQPLAVNVPNQYGGNLKKSVDSDDLSKSVNVIKWERGSGVSPMMRGKGPLGDFSIHQHGDFEYEAVHGGDRGQSIGKFASRHKAMRACETRHTHMGRQMAGLMPAGVSKSVGHGPQGWRAIGPKTSAIELSHPMGRHTVSYNPEMGHYDVYHFPDGKGHVKVGKYDTRENAVRAAERHIADMSVKKSLSPGLYSFDGLPAKRETADGHPLILKGVLWEPVDDVAAFVDRAEPITRARFVELRKAVGLTRSDGTGGRVTMTAAHGRYTIEPHKTPQMNLQRYYVAYHPKDANGGVKGGVFSDTDDADTAMRHIHEHHSKLTGR